jgi:alpha-ribazole phosphatase
MELYLIRHGHCETAGKDNYDPEKKTVNPKLTEKGIAQVRRLAIRLKNVRFDRIYHSDLSRAVDTAKILNDAVGSVLVEEAGFREIDMGVIHLSSWDSYPELYKEWVKHETDLAYPGGESGGMAWERYSEALDRIVNQDFSRVAVVAHGGAIRSMVCGMLEIPQEKRFYLGSPVENCSVSIVNYNKENQRYTLHVFNDFAHLTVEAHL